MVASSVSMRPEESLRRRCRNVADASTQIVRRIRGLQRDGPQGGSRAARCSEVRAALCATPTRTSIVIRFGVAVDRGPEASTGSAPCRMCERGGGAARAPARCFQHNAVEMSRQPDLSPQPASRPSRKSRIRERGGGAVKVRRPRGSGVGAKRRTLTDRAQLHTRIRDGRMRKAPSEP